MSVAGKATRVSIALVSSAALAATSIGVADAAPAPMPVAYSTTVEAGAVRTVLEAGAFEIASDGSSVSIVDSVGSEVTSIPLAYSVDSNLFPVAGAVTDDGRTLTLTPEAPLLLHPVYSEAAYQNLLTQIEIGWRNGGSVTAGIGAGIGAVVGCVLFLFVGCIPGAALGVTIGIVNGVVSANPAVTPAVFEFIRTLP